jgi:SAM-dependent methyltransferase
MRSHGRAWIGHYALPRCPVFDDVTSEYDQARPSYPTAVIDALEPLDGRRVLDVGAGTGIASRLLLERGAHVIAADTSAAMLVHAREYSPELPIVVADGARLPLANRSVDLICFAQAWHWLDPVARHVESARVLRRSGRWAAWWSHARADGEPWFDQTWQAIEAACAGTHRGQRDTDWGNALAELGLFDVDARVTIAWRRELSISQWVMEHRSYSYVAALADADATALLSRIESLARDRFPRSHMTIPYETWLWTATLGGG